MIADLQKQLNGLNKTLAQAEANFKKAVEDVRKHDPATASKLDALMLHAKTGKADPMKIFEEAIKLATK